MTPSAVVWLVCLASLLSLGCGQHVSPPGDSSVLAPAVETSFQPTADIRQCSDAPRHDDDIFPGAKRRFVEESPIPVDPAAAATRLIERLIARDFSGALRFGSRQEIESLQSAWQNATAASGEFRGLQIARTFRVIHGRRYVPAIFVQCEFENKSLPVWLAIDSEGGVAGLLIDGRNPFLTRPARAA